MRRRYEEDAHGRRNGILSSWRHSRRSGGPDDTGFRCTYTATIVSQGEEAADYLMTAGKDLINKCEDLYERGGEQVEDASHGLSGKYRALLEYSKQAVGEAEAILRRAKTTVSSQ